MPKIKSAHIAAIAFTAIIGVWMYHGEIKIGGQSANANESLPIAEREEANTGDLFKVSYVSINPEKRSKTIMLRGRTKAEAIIPVRSETSGVLQERLVSRGDFVQQGQLVCKIAPGAREAAVASAKARMSQMQADFAANEALVKKGFATDTRLRQIRFEMDAAKSQLEAAELEYSNINIKAQASGIVQDPIAEQGDVLTIGSTCITLVDRDPMFFTGQLSETDINDVKIGMTANVELVTGVKAKGTITYISPSADPQTRTFLTDIRIDAESDNIRAGLTASAAIELAQTSAFRISPSWLTLANNGDVGVKVIDNENKVQFKQVKILSQTNDGFWIEGLDAGSRVITLGQEYVIPNEIVDPVPDTKFASPAKG